jgi:hypothetical protein
LFVQIKTEENNSVRKPFRFFLKIISENSNNGIPNRRDRKNKPVPKIGTLLVLTT